MGPLASLKARLGGLPRAVLLHLLLVVLVPVAAAFAPLADHLSYEFAELMALVFGSTGGAVGLLVGRRSLLAGSSIPAPGLRGLSPARAASFPALRVTLGSLAVPVALILLNGLRRPVCDPLAGLAMYVVLVVPSALLSLALGRLCALLWPRRAGLLYALVALVSLADTLAPVLAGPQVFAHNHLLGLYPGPIYDEAIALTPAILRFRLITLALALVCALVPWVRPLWRERGFGLWPRLLAAKIVLVALAALLGAHLVSKPLRPTIADLDEALGGRIETAHLILHFPREKSGLERTLMVRDAEASVTAVLEFFALPAGPLHKVDVFLYRSAEEKQRLIGAADTSFAKPWLHEVHTNDAPAPHPVLRHELVHAFGAEVSHTPFGVPGRLGGLVPDMAFIEGLAVAGDFPWGEGTIHEETAAMRAQGRLPDLVQLFSPGRFYGESGARAYTAAGSLLRFLWETRGPAALARAYASPQGIAVLGPLDQLVAGHAKFLDTIQVPPNVASNASLRFAAPAIVHKRCPHEVADLERRAAQAANRGDSEAALALFEQCVALEPDDPQKLIALRRALLQARKAQAPEGAAEARALLDRATRVGDELLAHPKLAKPQLVQLLTDRGDEAWSRDDLAEARARYQAALALPQPDGQRRALEARVHGLELADAAPTLRKLFIEQDTGPDTILRLRDLDLANHADGLAAYLLAKQLQNHQDWPACVTYAADALGRALPSRLFLLEALRMQAVCAIKSEQSELAERTLRLLRPMVTPGRQLELDRLRALIAPAAAPAPPPAPAPRP